MKFFVTGVNGQLGHDVMNEMKKRGHEAVGSDIQDCCNAELPYISLDITDEKAVDKAICDIKPDAVIHCAAWTAVDMAENNENVYNVRAVNAGGTRNIANACKKSFIKLAGNCYCCSDDYGYAFCQHDYKLQKETKGSKKKERKGRKNCRTSSFCRRKRRGKINKKRNFFF